MALKKKFEVLQQQLKDHVELIQHLKSLPVEEAAKLLRRMNTVSDVSNVLASISGSSHGQLQLSNIQTARSLSPPTQTTLEFELMASHKMAYPKLVSIDTASIILSPSIKQAAPTSLSDNGSLVPYKSTEDHDALSTIPSSSSEDFVSMAWIENLPPTLQEIDRARASPLIGPIPARSFVDDRLLQLRIKYWTKIPVSDGFVASVLSFYFELDHPVLGFFDADLFLSDLANHRLQFCSSFLVSSLMHYACVGVSQNCQLRIVSSLTHVASVHGCGH
jgi:hypothetical protein